MQGRDHASVDKSSWRLGSKGIFYIDCECPGGIQHSLSATIIVWINRDDNLDGPHSLHASPMTLVADINDHWCQVKIADV